MKVINSIDEMRQWSRLYQLKNETIGLVPTMGYLHEGHLSLVKKARQISDKVIVSVFVNPTQFAANEDLDTYPSDTARDLDLCKKEKVDAVFMPDKNEMYHPDHQTYTYNQEIGNILCGVTRPDHFKGVTTIVCKLFNIIDPDYSVFGQKDAQQAIILKNMVRDLNFRTQVIIEPIIREKDGLALSSRNKYLNNQERSNALILKKCLHVAEDAFNNNKKDTMQLQEELKQMIANEPYCKVDYVEFVNADSLKNNYKSGEKVLLAIAVFVGKTRLIDNTILTY